MLNERQRYREDCEPRDGQRERDARDERDGREERDARREREPRRPCGWRIAIPFCGSVTLRIRD
ncbi:MAG TPA: hypothetical protein VF618_22520 [Thermoanaerobaculia bacterium]